MDYSEFKEHFSILSDTRQARKSTYNFFEVMFQVVTAMLCGMKTWDEIEGFGEEKFNLAGKIHEHARIYRLRSVAGSQILNFMS